MHICINGGLTITDFINMEYNYSYLLASGTKCKWNLLDEVPYCYQYHVLAQVQEKLLKCQTILDLERTNLSINNSTKGTILLMQTIGSVGHNASDLRANKDYFIIFDRHQKSSSLHVNIAMIACH